MLHLYKPARISQRYFVCGMLGNPPKVLCQRLRSRDPGQGSERTFYLANRRCHSSRKAMRCHVTDTMMTSAERKAELAAEVVREARRVPRAMGQ